MRLVVNGADRAGAVDRLDAVPDLRRPAAGGGLARTAPVITYAAAPARPPRSRRGARASRSSRKVAAASGQITAASLCAEGSPLSSIRPRKLASAACRVPFDVLRHRGLHEAQPSVGQPRRQQPEPDRAGRRGHQHEQRGGNRRRGAARPRHRRQRRAAEQRRQRGRQHGQETQPVNPDPGGALQHRERSRETAGPDIADQVPRKPGQDMAAQPFGRAPQRPRTGRSAPPAPAAAGARHTRSGRARRRKTAPGRPAGRTRRTARPTRTGRYRQTAPPRSSRGRRRRNRDRRHSRGGPTPRRRRCPRRATAAPETRRRSAASDRPAAALPASSAPSRKPSP